MDVLLFNSFWMIYNLSLGMIALSSGWLVVKTSILPIRAMLAVIWLLFVPNTLYILTDIIHVSRQWGLVGDAIKILLTFQYAFFIFLGIVLFVVGLFPFEQLFVKLISKRRSAVVAGIVVMNFIIAFGVAMGRIEGVNSWEVFIDTKKVFEAAISIANSLEAMMLVVFFGIFGNIIYFCLKRDFLKMIMSFRKNFLEY